MSSTKGCDFLLKSKFIKLKVSEKLYALLKKKAYINGCSMAFIVRHAVNRYVSMKGWNKDYESN